MARARTPIRRKRRSQPVPVVSAPAAPYVPNYQYLTVPVPGPVLLRLRTLFNVAKEETMRYEEAMEFTLAGLGISKTDLKKIDLNAGTIEYRKEGS